MMRLRISNQTAASASPNCKENGFNIYIICNSIFPLTFFVMCRKSFEACALKKYINFMCGIALLVCARAEAHISDETLLVTSILLQKMEQDHRYLHVLVEDQPVCLFGAIGYIFKCLETSFHNKSFRKCR